MKAVTMAAEGRAGVDIADSLSVSLSFRLKSVLSACSKSYESEDHAKSCETVEAVVKLLNSIVDQSQGDNNPDNFDAEKALEEISLYLSSSSSNQSAVEALSLELPKVVVKFMKTSDKCRDAVRGIIDCVVATSSPRDMLLILCEALGSQLRDSDSPIYFVPLLDGITKVLLRIERRHVQQLKMVLPVILNVLHACTLQTVEDDKDNLKGLFVEAVRIGTSIQALCGKMVGRTKKELHAILGLYTLQNIALISRIRQLDIIPSYCALVMQLSELLSFCGFSIVGLITGSEVTSAVDLVCKDDDDDDNGDILASFSLASNGASLSVIWEQMNNEVAKTANEKWTSIINKIQRNPSQRWQAIEMLKPIFLSVYSSEIKSHCIDLLVTLMDASNIAEQNDNSTDFSSFFPNYFAVLQAIQRFMIGFSDALLRKKAFSALRKLISDLPSSYRFDTLKDLISNSNSPSMIAILIDLVREVMVSEGNHKTSSSHGPESYAKRINSPFWSPRVLDLVELILKPPKGGPPALPEDCDAVLSVLNLFRFILIIESTGKTNYTGVLSESTLRRAYSEWLLPLRTLVTGIQAENVKDETELAHQIQCAMNPVQFVLYRCIELVEDNLKHPQ